MEGVFMTVTWCKRRWKSLVWVWGTWGVERRVETRSLDEGSGNWEAKSTGKIAFLDTNITKNYDRSSIREWEWSEDLNVQGMRGIIPTVCRWQQNEGRVVKSRRKASRLGVFMEKGGQNPEGAMRSKRETYPSPGPAVTKGREEIAVTAQKDCKAGRVNRSEPDERNSQTDWEYR